MKKLTIILLTLIISSVQAYSQSVDFNFKQPTVVQNYPVDHQLNMDGAKLAYKAINKLIKSAKKTIDIEEFYIDNKPHSFLDKYIIKPIIKKAKSGVKVRIIVDANMAKTYPDTVNKLSLIRNIKVRKISLYDKNGVMHAKMILVDNKRFYLGSHNLDWVTFKLNHELGIIFENKRLADVIKKGFDFDWKASKNKSTLVTQKDVIDSGSKEPYEITISPNNIKGVTAGQKRLIELINSAKKKICMQAMQVMGINYDGSTWKAFTKAILNAAARGVKVKIMFSNWEFTHSYINASNQFLQSLIDNDKKGNIKIRYSSFPPHKPCVPYSEVDHAKYAIFDNTVWISTANLTESYFTHCRNYSFIARHDKKLTKQMLNIFNTMWNSKYMTTYHKKVVLPTDNTCAVDV